MNTTKPHCSRCKKEKPIGQLNGYNPLEKDNKRYANAYCRDILNCDSVAARETLAFVIDGLKED